MWRTSLSGEVGPRRRHEAVARCTPPRAAHEVVLAGTGATTGTAVVPRLPRGRELGLGHGLRRVAHQVRGRIWVRWRAATAMLAILCGLSSGKVKMAK